MMKTINIFKTFLLSLLLTFGLGVQSQVATFPHTSDFEGSLGDWVNPSGDNGDFSVDANGTPSSGTGPSIAQSGSYYVYTETSGSGTWGGQIWLECRYDFSTLTDATIDFWYHKYSANGGTNGPGILSLDVFDGASWTYDVFRDELGNADAWKNAVVDLSMYAGRPDVRLSWTVWVSTPQGWQCDIALDNIVVNGAGGGGGPPTCATIPYDQNFETGQTDMTGTSGSQSSVGIDARAANSSLLGLHLQGNTSSSWSSSYSTGALAFANSPYHIASGSREICASTDPTVTLTFDKAQTYSYNPNYCWFRLTVDGIPISDDQGNTYYNADNGPHKTFTYDLSAYANTDIVVAWEGCMKYYDYYYGEGDNIFIDNIIIVEQAGGAPPSAPGTISGNDYPNGDQTGLTYSISPVNNATSYTWATPVGWVITAGQGSTDLTVIAGSIDGNITVAATNSYGTSANATLAVKSAELERTFPYEVDFENETQHSATASNTGFRFVANGWRNVDGDDGDWRADAGGTPSSGTGPGDGSSSGQSDHSPGTSVGKYLYVESTSPNFPSKEFHLWSPPFDLTVMAVPTLTFWYSMYSASGAQMGLQYSLTNGDTWEPVNIAFMCSTTYTNPIIYQNMGTTWRQGFVDLSGIQSQNNVMFRFVIQTGTSFDSDICLDDIKMVDAAATAISVGENITLGSSAYSGAYGLILDGSSAQTITPAGNSVSHITINNSNGVTINGGNLKVDGVLTLASGVISTGSNVLIITNTSASAIAGGSGSSFIYGDLRRHIAPNTGTYSFPIGQGAGPTNYYRADLINNNMNLPGNTDFVQMSVAAITETGDNIDLNLNTSQGGTYIGNFHEDAVWTMSPSMGGTFLSGSYGLKYYTANVIGLIDNKFTIVKRDGGSTTYADWKTHDDITTIPTGGAAGRTVASGYAQKLGFTAFSEGGVGSGSDPLPIELVDFTAQLNDDDKVDITWTTASEINNDYFTVERSKDGSDFDIIVTIQGAGTSNQMLYYEETDNYPLKGLSYYRLKQTDYDGKFSYSSIVAVKNLETLNFSVMPNPTTDNLTVTFGKIEGNTVFVMTPEYKAGLKIYNVEGKVIYKKNFHGTFYKFSVNVSYFPEGIYYVVLKANKETYKANFIKQ